MGILERLKVLETRVSSKHESVPESSQVSAARDEEVFTLGGATPLKMNAQRSTGLEGVFDDEAARRSGPSTTTWAGELPRHCKVPCETCTTLFPLERSLSGGYHLRCTACRTAVATGDESQVELIFCEECDQQFPVQPSEDGYHILCEMCRLLKPTVSGGQVSEVMDGGVRETNEWPIRPPSLVGGASTASSSSPAVVVSGAPPELTSWSVAAIRAFITKWNSYVAQTEGCTKTSPLDHMTHGVLSKIRARLATGTLPADFMQRVSEEPVVALQLLLSTLTSSTEWEASLDALRKIQLGVGLEAFENESLPKFLDQLEICRTCDPRVQQDESPYIAIFVTDFLRRYPALVKDAKAHKFKSLSDVYKYTLSHLKVLATASRFETKGETQTKNRRNDAGSRGKGDKDLGCFICGKAHSWRKCDVGGTWAFREGRLVCVSDKTQVAKYPDGGKTKRNFQSTTSDGAARSVRIDGDSLNATLPPSSVKHQGWVAGKLVDILFDIGAEVDIIAASAVPEDATVKAEKRVFTQMDGSSFVTTGVVEVPIKVDNSLLVTPVVGKVLVRVVENPPDDVILSYVTIRRLGLGALVDLSPIVTDQLDPLMITKVKGGAGLRAVAEPISSFSLDFTGDDLDIGSKDIDAFPVVADKPVLEAPPEVHGAVDDNDPIVQVIQEYKDLFSNQIPLKPCSLPSFKLHRIEGLPLPKPRPAMRLSSLQDEWVENHVNKLRKQGVMVLSRSPVASQLLVADKPKGPEPFRMCLNPKDINAVTYCAANPLPSIDTLVNDTRGAKFFASFDLVAAYHQFHVHKDSQYLLGCRTMRQLLQWTRVPFGIHGAPPHVQACMYELLQDIKGVTVYLDDILCFHQTREGLANIMRQVLQRLRSVGMVLRPAKCIVGTEEIEYLGFVIDGSGKKIPSKKVDAFKELPLPNSRRKLRGFLGSSNYFRSFVKDYATIAAPLYDMLKGKNKSIIWNEDRRKAFESLKTAVTTAPSVKHFDMKAKCTVLRSDASIVGWGAVLLQGEDEDNLHPIAFLSGKWSPTQQRWSTIEQECGGLVMAISKMEHYLRTVQCIIETDHANLLWMSNSRNVKVQRWNLYIQSFRLELRHIPGSKNVTADMLSRSFKENKAAIAAHVRENDLYKGWLEKDFQRIIEIYHGTIVGHSGVQRTVQLLRADGFDWPNMTDDVREFVESCEVCQATDPRTSVGQIHPLGSLSSLELFDEYSIDFHGPYPPDRFGRKYVLTAVDNHSRQLEAIPTVGATAEDAAWAIIQIFGRYGAPRKVRVDNAQCFVGDINTALTKMLGSELIQAVPFQHNTNGLIERCHREILRHFRALLFENKDMENKWGEALAFVLRIINATPSLSTGVAPVVLTYCGQVQPDRYLFKHVVDKSKMRKGPSSFIANVEEMQEALIMADDLYLKGRFKEYADTRVEAIQKLKNQVSRRQRKVIHRHMEKIKATTKAHDFKVGDLVTLAYPDRPPTKLSPKVRGPFKVSNVHKDIIHVSSLISNSVYRVGPSRLRHWKQNKLDPKEAARKAEPTSYVPRAIIDFGVRRSVHKPISKNDYVFLVQWEGYDDPQDDTWQSYDDVKHLEVLKTFLKTQPSLPEVFQS